ncbi:sensor histidine kinase [Paenibacillus sp. GCM10027626]|uniref:sensor histidine kinase n=1 Tax=Paenibacillus sp. GCM10027626 TaxID=3273411 RepID=UPI0036451841
MGKAIMTWLMNRKLFVKIFVSICIVSFTGLFFLAAAYQQYTQRIFTASETDRVQRSINQAGLNLDNQLNRIVSNIFYFFYYTDMGAELLETKDREKAKAALAAFRLQYSSELDSALFIVRDESTGSEILLYDSGLDPVTGINYREQSWYKKFSSKQTTLWSEPTDQLMFYQDRSLHTIYLTLGKYDVGGKSGMLVVRLNGKMFSDAFRLLATENLSIELKDSAGRAVYTSFPEVPEAGRAHYLETNSQLGYSGFRVQAYISSAAIKNEVRKIQSVQPYVIVLILLITLLISFVLSYTLVRPIRKLVQLMKRVEMGDLDVRFTGKYSDEIGLLGRNFNKMLATLSDMIDTVYKVQSEKFQAEMKQKDATLLAMQNQINPHFLYNTLEVINCQAILNEVPSISRMSKALADFFRYPVDNKRAEVTLRIELSHVETYLQIQQERYPDIELDLDGLEPFYHYPIVKLTLQPIVENAFLYAFTGERDYYLKIYAEDCGSGAYAVYIEDNGQGMPEADMDELNKLLAAELEPKEQEAAAGIRRGIGLLNVHHRIRLRYGNGYGLHVEESMAGGVTVRIILPKEGDTDADISR